jgi:formylglycine-generating enzyme required for sulfatase activity
MFRKAITALLARSAVWAVLAVLAISALAQAQSSWGQQAGLTNPGFEEPRVEEGTFVLADVLLETMPGWKTTDTHFEIWGTGFKGVPAHEGTQFVELNAYIDGTLYQDSTGIQQGSILEFTFAHRGRNGDDTMKMTITDLGADNSLGGGDDTVLFTKEYTTGKDAWAVYESTNEQKIEALGNTVRFGYGAVSTATGELGEGNLLDAANFGVGVVTAPPIAADGTETNSLGMEFKLIPAGKFIVGSPDCEEGRDDDEQQHVVTITSDYYMGVTEVTQSQWQQVMGTTPWKGQEHVMEGDEIAASYISWNDATEFCERLSALEGRTYRLPTEAEWECACRAGSTTKYSFGKDDSQLEQYAWYWDSEPTHPSQVKQKSPNGFGLYDMHGNVYELCQDWYGAYPQGNVTDPTGPSNGSERIIRGGGFAAKAPRVRSAMRLTVKDLALGENHLGLRVVMVPEADSGESPLNETPPENAMQRDVDLVGNSATNKLGMEFKRIPAGTFMIGSPDSEAGRGDDETQHEVTITRDYYMGVTEVTQSQWQQVMGTTPWKGQEQVVEGNEIAASYISWNDAVEFCRKLSQQEGRTYRLPTEAEWEYACRGGTTTAYSFGDDVSQLEQYAWYYNSEPNHSSQVKQKSPNGYGLYDMHGNLLEFCQDWYGDYPQGSVIDPPGASSGTNRVCRGGCFVFGAPLVRSASRRFILDSTKPFPSFGLRVVLVPESGSGQLALNRAKDLLRGHWIPNLDETSKLVGELQASEREVLAILSVEFTSRSISLLVQDEPVSLSINTEIVTPNEFYDLKQTAAGDTFQLVLKDEEGVEHLDGVQFLSETQILVTLGKGGRPIVLDWSRGVAEDTSGVVEDTSRATVVAWGNNEKGQTNVPDGLSDIIAIAAGGEHSMALKADGTVVAWGNNGAKQTDIPRGLSGVIAIAAGGDHSLALKQDGTVVAWGFNFFGQTSVPEGLSGVTAIAAGNRFSMALKADGTVVAWGEIENYLLTPPEGLSGVTAIDAGNAHSLALKQDGTVVAWGTCTYGSYKRNVPERLSGVTAIAAAWSDHDVALKQDGTIVGWASPDSSNDPPDVFGEPKFPAGMSGIIAIAAGEKCDLALKQDGTVVAWGSNEHGVTDIPEGLSDVTAIAAGRKHALALLRNGKAQ